MKPTDLHRLTLPLIGLVALNVLPGVALRPLWSVIFCAVLLGYRAWLHLNESPMPPRWIMLLGQVTVAVAVWQHYFSFFGDEAAGTFLTLLMCLKVYELRRERDFFVAALLCLLTLMSVILLDQTLFMTVFLLVDVSLLIAFMFAIEQGLDLSSLRGQVGRSVVLMLKAIPLMAVIFVLFPRFSTGFGTGANPQGKTGVTDRLAPGSVSNLIKSDELVFRATFLDGNVPARAGLYWRGAVLDKASGLNWERTLPKTFARPRDLGDDPAIEVYLEPGYDKFLFALDSTPRLRFPNGTRVSQRDDRTFELDNPLQVRERYLLFRGLDTKTADDPEGFTHIEEAPSPRVRALLKQTKEPTTARTVGKLLEYFRRDEFSYTLSPKPVATIDDFLFGTKSGFCEHYAATMATLLRYQGIPARVVVGFQGGSPSLLENYMTVRSHDAHAWVEYFDVADQRWHRNDPTAQVDPQRIVMGAQAYQSKRSEWALGRYLEKGRALFDEIDANWTGFLLRFDLARQKELLAKFGMEGVLFRALPLFLVLAIVLMLAVLYYLEASRREVLSEDEALYRRLDRKLKRWKLERRPQEGPLLWLERVRATRPTLAAQVEPLLMAFTRVRYGGEPLDPAARKTLRAAIRRLTWAA